MQPDSADPASDPASDSASDVAGRQPRVRRRWLVVAGGLAALFAAAQAADGTDLIDLPSWANIRGVDVPLVGDTDTLDCRLSSEEGSGVVEIRLVDGDRATYPDFAHVWRNGNLVDPTYVERLADDLFTAPGTIGEEQFYAISIHPERDDRVFCESIVPR